MLATDCSWSLVAAGSMPVVQTRQNNVVQNPSQSRWRRGHHVWMIATRFWHWQMTQVGRSLLDSVVQYQVKPCRLANKACTVSVVELSASEVDHAAHDWCDRTCSVHRWVVQRCSSLLAADSVDIVMLQPVDSCSSQYVISHWQYCCLPFLQHPLGVL